MMRTCYRCILVLFLGISVFASDRAPTLELSRPVRTWEFMGSFGQRAGVFGKEDGSFEAWVYPMKLLRDFRLTFHVAGQAIPAATVARTIIVHPESTTIVYAYDQFEVRETICVPVHKMGAIIKLETNAHAPVRIEASYTNDLQLMWPAGLGDAWPGFDEKLDAFTVSGGQYFGIIGAKGLTRAGEAYVTNYGSSQTSAFDLPEVPKGTTTQVIAIAGSIKGHDDAAAEYEKLLANADQLEQDSAQYYRDYLARTVSVDFPDDRKLQEAYDWARVSVIQGLVDNPYLGTGLVAGYRRSGFLARPGFAWFFGRDAEWTSLALNSIGDFATTKTALEFLLRVQLENGRIPHEVSQTAALVDWFNKYPFATASADATPLFTIAVDDYVTQSGDMEFAKQNWEHIAKAYEWLKSTYDAEGFAKNEGVGTGWVEGGPLVPIHSELYQAGLAVQAERALGHIASLVGKNELAAQMSLTAADRLRKVEQKFWMPSKNAYAFGIGTDGKMNETVSVEATVPMWFGLLKPERANAMIDQLASSHHSTDWGMRIMSDEAPGYSPDGYHNGAVWPLFTGWAAVGEYRYHRALAAYQNMRENAMLTLDGALGHDTEVLSGAYFQQHSIASPHQIWSAAMVISPVLRGMMGLTNDATHNELIFSPHVPVEWNSFTLRNVAAGHGTVDLYYSRSTDSIALRVLRHGFTGLVDFAPAISPIARATPVEVNGHRSEADITNSHMELASKGGTPIATFSSDDNHVIVRVSGTADANIAVHLENDFQLGIRANLPALGSTSENIKPISQTWTGKQVEYVFEGLGGHTYDLPVRGLESTAFITGAQVKGDHLTIAFPPDTGYVRQTIVVRFNK